MPLFSLFFPNFFPFRSRFLDGLGLGCLTDRGFLLLCVRIDPFLLVSGRDDLRDILSLLGVHRVDDRIEREVGAHELQSAGHAASHSSERHEIRCGTETPADSLLHFGRVVHLFRPLLDLPLEGSLPGLFRKREDGVTGGLAEYVIDG